MGASNYHADTAVPDTESLSQLLAAHPAYFALVLGLVAFVESFAILGIVVPGVAILAVAAFVAGAGAFPLWACLLCTFLGAVLGDGCSFLIGRYFKQNIRNIWPFSRHSDWIERGERFFIRYGVASVVIGRSKTESTTASMSLRNGALRYAWSSTSRCRLRQFTLSSTTISSIFWPRR